MSFMVRKSLQHSDSGPPPYPESESDSSPVVFSESTTVTRTEVVTTTTTHTTTHFFTFPLWKRKASSSAAVSHPAPTAMTMVDQPQSRLPTIMMDKELPPTPNTNSADTSLSPSQRTSIDDITNESRRPSLFPAHDQRSSTPSTGNRPFSTAALAQAALGVGLPHILPQASSSSSEINSVSFSNSLVDLTLPDVSNRRSSRWRAVSTAEPDRKSDSPSSKSRRSRGLSLGPSGFLGFTNADTKEKGKGKDKEVDHTQSDQSPSKVLVRKASFWSRKKSRHSTESARVPPDSPTTQSQFYVPPLPSVTPISPFNIDLSTSSSDRQIEHPRSNHTRGLSRSHSDRVNPARQSPLASEHRPADDLIPRPRPRRKSTRPSTTDSHNLPPVPRFLPLDSAPLTASPLSTPPIDSEKQFATQQIRPSELLRPRAQTNPPLLHRLSLNIFGSSSSHTLPASPSLPTPPVRLSPPKQSAEVPKPLIDDESPEGYLNRLKLAVSKSEIAGILASTADPFHVQALKVYITQFDFSDDPLDVALRRLLMDVGLPRETQQIDRVMEAFASRYYQCHSGLFTSEDHPYILAFSLIMLHTDAFNKSNKRKMTKADYIKNTKLPGVAPEVLDCFYDNIVFAPFIFIEDPLDVTGQRPVVPEGSRIVSSVGTPLSPNGNSGSAILNKNKVDPYYLICNKLLGPLRVNVEEYVPTTNPYSYEGTMGPWNEKELQRAFAHPSVVEVGLDSSRSAMNPMFFSLSVAGGPPAPLVGNIPPESWSLKVTKAGVLNRKDDVLEGGKKASSRKWRPWSVILTGSQVLLFRDSAFVNLLATSPSLASQSFRPDEVLSVKDAVAVYDKSYTKHDCTFRLAMPDGRQILWGTSSDEEMNEWIARINYASAFKSSGVRMRPLGMSGRDVQLTGVAAATSHLHDLQHGQRVRNWDKDTSRDLMSMLSGNDSRTSPSKKPSRRATIASVHSTRDTPAEAPEIDGADQFIATFDQVKADLAAGRCASPDVQVEDEVKSSLTRSLSNPISPDSLLNDNQLNSRSNVVLSKIKALESQISVVQTQLDSDERFVRNVGTLTPFQRATRERLIAAVQNISKRVMQSRLDVMKMTCHRDVLFRDLVAEAQDWSRAKKVALRVATETLQSQQAKAVPRMTLSFHDSDTSGTEPEPITQNPYTPSSGSSQRPESMTGSVQSFHSALEFAPEWVSPDDVEIGNRLASDSLIMENEPDEDNGSIPKRSWDASPRNSDDSRSRSHEKFYTAQEAGVEEEEVAEQWNKTRAAQRVSLVRMPSVLGFEKPRRHRTHNSITEMTTDSL